MSEIKQNTQNISAQMPQYLQPQQHPQGYPMGYANIGYMMPPQRAVKDEFVHQHKKNGLIERLYNGIKNLTGLGIGSKKAEQAIEKAESGEITEEEARKTIDRYRKSQQSSAQAMGDVLSIGASGMTFFSIRKWLKMGGAKAVINKKYYENLEKRVPSLDKKFNDKWLKYGESKTKAGMTAMAIAALAGAFTKYFVLKFNRIGSQDKVKKKDYNNLATPMDNAQYKYDKKARKREKRKESWHNFLSGAINGLTMPITMLGGAIVGIPAYFATNSLNRYFVGNTTEDKKSFQGYVENLKDDALLHTAVVGATVVPMVKKAKFHNVFDKNIVKAANRLKDVTLNPSEYIGKSTFDELDEILMNSESVKKITKSGLTLEEQVKQLSEENIFAVKFKQIKNDGSELTNALKEDCPPTRCHLKGDGSWDLTKIQDYVKKNLGNYEIKQCLGVGTVAETYLAKGPDGKEVCLKVLKEGIDAEKIAKDKKKFIDIINNLDPSQYTKEQKEYFIKNIDDLADGIAKEVDFENELKAAKELAKHTKVANVVNGLEVKNGIYVMERAKGISLQSLVDLNTAYQLREAITKSGKKDIKISKYHLPEGSKLEKLLKDKKDYDSIMNALNNYIKKVESRTPGLADSKLTVDDYRFMVYEYQQVLIEQFNKVDKNGKVLHADIHPGNIFIDIEKLKNRKKVSGIANTVSGQLGYRKPERIFTLIDTGNTINQTMEQALDSINLTSYVSSGNYKDLAKYVVKGCKGDKTEAQMAEIMEKELHDLFLDDKTYIGKLDNEKLLSISSNIMRKHGVLPSDTQLNLTKARQSANNSRDALLDDFGYLLLKDYDFNSGGDILKAVTKAGAEVLSMKNQYDKMISAQEKQNLLQMTQEQIKKHKKNPNMPAKNSEDYLFYRLKRSKKILDGDDFLRYRGMDTSPKFEFKYFLDRIKDLSDDEIRKEFEHIFKTVDKRELLLQWHSICNKQVDIPVIGKISIGKYATQAGLPANPDFSDPELQEKIIKFVIDYKSYLGQAITFLK